MANNTKSKKSDGIVHDTHAPGLRTEKEFTSQIANAPSDTPAKVDEDMVEQQRLQIKAAELKISVKEVKALEDLEADEADEPGKDTSEEE